MPVAIQCLELAHAFWHEAVQLVFQKNVGPTAATPPNA